MSLIPVHRGLITAAIVFCIGYGAWELTRYARAGSGTSLVVGVTFLVLAAALAYYLSRLTDFLGYRRGSDRFPGGGSANE